MTKVLRSKMCVVRGEYSGALYDLQNGRIRRISLDLCDLLQTASLDHLYESYEWARAAIDRLTQLGYVCDVLAPAAQSYSPGCLHPILPSIRLVRVDLTLARSGYQLDRIFGLISHAADRYNLLTCILRFSPSWLPSKLSAPLTQIVQKHKALILGLEATDETQALTSELEKGFASCGRVRKVRVIDQMSVSPEHSLRCDDIHFSLLRNASESDGQLRIDSDGKMFPGIVERTYVIGTLVEITSAEFDAAIRSEAARKYWGTTKDQVQKCKDCELRYACLHPRALRTDATRIESTPFGCSYDPSVGVWAA